jgi:hypothetical protein
MGWFDELFNPPSMAVTEEDIALDRKRRIRRQKILETVTKVTDVAREGLDIYHQMQSKNPVSVGLGVLSAYGAISNNFFPAKVQAVSILREMGAELVYKSTCEFVMETMKLLGCSKEIFWQESGENGSTIEEYKLSTSSIYFLRESVDYIEGPYIIDKKLFCKEMASLISKKLGKYILLHTIRDDGGWGRNLSLTSLDPCEDPYISIIDEEKMVGDVKKFFEKNLNRSMLFYGPPGSGKTTLAMRLTEALGGSILILNGWALSNKSTGSIIHVIRMVNPSVILFDDLDRIHNMESLLSDLESLNRSNVGRNRLLIATVNDMRKVPKPMRRPGRFDQSIEFGAPDNETAKKILLAHAESLGLALADEDVEQLAACANGMTGAFLREIAIRTGVLGIKNMSEHIKDMRKVSKLSDKGADEYEEEDEEE